MDFGKVTPEELESVDFSLPPDNPNNQALLKKSKKKPVIHVGCAKWGRKDWIGKIYPKGTKEADFLEHYGKHFSSIELNATFYKMPSEKQTKAWSAKVGKDFKFCPKYTGGITHIKRLKDVTDLTERFYRGIAGFGDKLGSVLLMPHPGMGPKTFDVIESFIASRPKDLDIFVELRHKDWFANPETFDKVFTMIEKHKAGTVITDSAGRRDCVHMRLTTPSTFIRFVGNGLHPTDYTRCDEWIGRIKTWMDGGIQTVYFFMHQHEELHSPELARYFIEKLNQETGTSIPVPQFVE